MKFIVCKCIVCVLLSAGAMETELSARGVDAHTIDIENMTSEVSACDIDHAT